MLRFLLSVGLALTLVSCGGEEPATTGTASPEAAEERSAYEEEDIAAVTDGGVTLLFATAEQGGDVLTADDAHGRTMAAMELSVRAQSVDITTYEGLKPLYRQDVMVWSNEEREDMRAAFANVMDALDQVDEALPREVLLVKTGSFVEGGLPHTRSHAIIFAGGELPSGEQLERLILHETAHVLSRASSDDHDNYFAIIGFEPCRFEAADSLRARRLTNPDAPFYRHYAPVETDVEGADGVIPFLALNRAYTGEGTLSDYFAFGLVPVRVVDGVCTSLVTSVDELVSPGAVPGFMDLIGRNTGYIIHPEEVLADNFVLWGTASAGAPDPEIPEAVGGYWTEE